MRAQPALLAVLLLALPGVAAAAPSMDPVAKIEIANAYLAAAIAQPRNPDLWRVAGDLAYRTHDAVGAYAAWQRAAALAPGDVPLLSRVAHGAFAVGDFSASATAHQALLAALEARGSAPRAARIYHLTAGSEAATLAGDFTAAERSAKRAIRAAKTRPERVTAQLALAYVYLHGLEYDEAEGLYTDVLAVEPEQITALNNLGNIHYMRRDFDSAARLFTAVLEVTDAPADAVSVAYANLAELHQLQAQFKDARWLYEQARDWFPEGAWAHFGLAALADLEGDHDQAIEHTIDGWERDRSRLTRLNTVFVQPEWTWQRDALIAEVEGEHDRADTLWGWVAQGDVAGLRSSAHVHLGRWARVAPSAKLK